MVQCIENRIALYSPHTAWDAIQETATRHKFYLIFLPVFKDINMPENYGCT
jgi:hypothetical protein